MDANTNPIELCGTVAAVIYQNEENGYTILRLDAGEEEMTVVGSMPGVSPGEYLTVRGQWVRHATYGAQFKAEIVERRLPQSLKEVFHYLASGAVKGVGKSTARRLVEEFGEDALRVMEEEPEKLASIKGITPKRARQISESFRQQMGMRRLMEFLGEHQLPLTLGTALYRAYGDVALEVLRSNPYLIVGEEFGVEFSQADQLALSLGVGGEDPQRLEAGLLFELAHNLNNGHSFLPRRKLIEATAILLDVSGGLLEPCLEALAGRGEVVCEAVAGEDGVYLPALYDAECYVAWRVGEMSRSELLPPDDLDKLIARIQRDQGIRYAPQQREAVELAACRQVMLLTGGPGTGKTTSSINLAGELVRRGKRVLLIDMDTQGNATSNLSLTEIPAATLTDTVCHTTTENLDLIRGGSLLAPALATMQEMPFGRDTTLRRLLPQIPDTYDFVFFDCSPSLESLFNINVLVAVQYVLIPIKVDKNSIEGYDVMLETIQSVREIANPDIRALGIFMTAVETGSSLDREMIANFPAMLPGLAFQTYIRKNIDVKKAPLALQPLCFFSPRCTATADYAALCDEMLARMEG